MLVAQKVGNQTSPSPAELGAWFFAALQLIRHPSREQDETCQRLPPPCPFAPCPFLSRQHQDRLAEEVDKKTGEKQKEEI